MVSLPPEAGSEGGLAHQPLLRRLRHAENSDRIERGKGRDRLPLV